MKPSGGKIGVERTRLSPVYIRHRQSLEVGSPESLAIHLNDELLGRCRSFAQLVSAYLRTFERRALNEAGGDLQSMPVA